MKMLQDLDRRFDVGEDIREELAAVLKSESIADAVVLSAIQRGESLQDALARQQKIQAAGRAWITKKLKK